MTFGFDFHPEARAELFADVDWYDEREAGAGERTGRSNQGCPRLPLPGRLLRSR
jgi:hypothetical protein